MSFTDLRFPPLFSELYRLHWRILFRYIKKLHKEIAVLIVVMAGFEMMSAGNVEHSIAPLLFQVSTGGIVLLQFARKDKRFLRLLLGNPRRFLLYENVMLIAPFAALLVVLHAFLPAVISLLVAAVVSQILWTPVARNRIRFRSFMPHAAFEWTAGIKRRLPGLVLIYAGGITFSSSGVLPFIAIPALAFIFATFYSDCESYLMIDAFAKRPRSFLLRKLGMSAILYLAFASPLMIIALLHIHAHWYLVPIAFCFGLLYIFGLVLMKYAYFEQGADQATQSAMRTIILFASLFVFPVTIVYELMLYRKARRTLPIFLNLTHAND